MAEAALAFYLTLKKRRLSFVLYETEVLKLALTEELLTRTHFFGASLFGRSAGLSRPDAVGRQDSELVLHPGTQVDDSGR